MFSVVRAALRSLFLKVSLEQCILKESSESSTNALLFPRTCWEKRNCQTFAIVDQVPIDIRKSPVYIDVCIVCILR